MSGRIKIKSKDKDKRPKIDVFKVIENRFKNMNELRDLIDMDPRKGLVRIRDGAGFRKGAGVIPAGKAIRDGSQPRSIGSVGCMITRCHVQIEQKRLGACIG